MVCGNPLKAVRMEKGTVGEWRWSFRSRSVSSRRSPRSARSPSPVWRCPGCVTGGPGGARAHARCASLSCGPLLPPGTRRPGRDAPGPCHGPRDPGDACSIARADPLVNGRAWACAVDGAGRSEAMVLAVALPRQPVMPGWMSRATASAPRHSRTSWTRTSRPSGRRGTTCLLADERIDGLHGLLFIEAPRRGVLPTVRAAAAWQCGCRVNRGGAYSGCPGHRDAGDAQLHVVGESHNQDALRSITGSGSQQARVATTAVLFPEEDNQYDADAISVWIQGKMVGHLSREDAVAMRAGLPTFKRASGVMWRCPVRSSPVERSEPLACSFGSILRTSGWRRRPSGSPSRGRWWSPHRFQPCA